MGLGGGPRPNPYVFEARDVNQRVIRITVPFNDTNGRITSVTVFRDPDCLYTKIYIGRGADGRPDSTPRQFTVPPGETVIAGNDLPNWIDTIQELTRLQITAGP